MKSILPAAGIAFAFAVTLGAQSTTPTQYPEENKTKSKSTMSSKSSKTVTLSGCVREGDEPNTYVLANVDMSAMRETASSAHGTSTSGTSGSATGSATGGSTASGTSSMGASSSDKANSVKLVGSANLKDHVGHQVEVTGTMAPQGKDKKNKTTGTSGTGSAAGETQTDTTSRPGERSSMSGDKNMHTLTVRSVKMVSANCSTN